MAAACDPRVLGRTTPTMKEYARAVSGMDLVVTNDGGPMHVAAALGVPTVALFGPTDERVFGPLGPHARVVRSKVAEAPCSLPWHVVRPCCADRVCLCGLSVDSVLDVAVDAVQRTTKAASS